MPAQKQGQEVDDQPQRGHRRRRTIKKEKKNEHEGRKLNATFAFLMQTHI